MPISYSFIFYRYQNYLILCQSGRSYVFVRSVILSVCEQDNGRPPNMVGMGKGYTVEVINFWC